MGDVGYCDTPHKFGEPTEDRKALKQTLHEEDHYCWNWKPVEDYIQKLEAEREQWIEKLRYTQTELEQIKDMGPNRCRELEERIHKAKRILASFQIDTDTYRSVLEALEGK